MTATVTAKKNTRLSPRERFTRGLTYTAVGPVDITRGTLGLSAQGVHSAGSHLRARYVQARESKEVRAAAERVAKEIAAAQELVAGLPQALHEVTQEVRHPKHRTKRIVVFSAAAAVTIAGGAIAFSIVRRSMQKDPSPRPPSVDVAPKP